MFKKIKGDTLTASLAFLLTLDIYHPGLMTHDSVLQLQDAVSGEFHDGSPPIMSLLWRLTNKIYFGPMGMLVFHCLVFWVGLFLLSRVLFEKTKHRSWFLILFGFFPSVFCQLGTVWKDVGLSVTLFLGSVLVLILSLRSRVSKSPLPLARIQNPVLWTLALCCFFYGLSVRHNAAPAVFILCLWLGIVINAQRPINKNKFRKILSAGAIGSIIFGLLFCLSLGLQAYFVSENKKQFAFQSIEVFDLAAISIEKKELKFPDFLKERPELSLPEVTRLFRPEDVGPYFFASDAIPWISEPAKIKILSNYWLKTISENPSAYLSHRVRYFKNLLGINREVACVPYNLSLDENPFNLYFRSNWIWRGYYDTLNAFKNSFIFRGYPYFLILILVMLASLYLQFENLASRPFAQASFFISLSGFLYAAGYFIYGPSCELRYIYWSILSCFVSSALLVNILIKRNER